MTDDPQPIRRRAGFSELNALLLPLLLLFPAAGFVGPGLGVVATTPTRIEVDVLRPLPVPRHLPFVRTRLIAAARTADVLDHATAEFRGLRVAEHVSALAAQQILEHRPARVPTFDTVGDDETLDQFRRRWRLTRDELVALNPDTDLDDLDPGASFCVWRFEPDRLSRSLGRPNRGRLERGEPMPEGDGWIIRQSHHAYGARQTIDALVHAMRTVSAAYPGGQELLIADISRPGGGRLAPHRSHQSGRDVDITYYRLTDEPPTFSHTPVSELDVERTWTFVRTLLTSHDVVYIFMSPHLQRALFEHAVSLGEHPAFLDQAFERGTNGHRNHRATIRFSPGHNDHMHIRFACAPHDTRCAASSG